MCVCLKAPVEKNIEMEDGRVTTNQFNFMAADRRLQVYCTSDEL